MSQARQNLGKKGEALAEAHLIDKGFQLLERCFRCRLGELDLVMQDGDTLVFVEVRTRHSSRFGSAAESIDQAKQKKLVRMAAFYLQGKRLQQVPVRFDVVAITGDKLEHIADAFRC